MFKRSQMPDTPARTKREQFVATVKSYVGYQANAGLRNQFGAMVGYDGLPWAGAFIDVTARESSVKLPGCVQTASALAEFIRDGQLRTKPLPGDIVFFAAAEEFAASAFEMPHVGVVVDVREFHLTGKFLSVEGNTRGGNPKFASTQMDGVYQRIRHTTEVLAFARPLEFEGAARFQLLTKVIEKLRAAEVLDEAAISNFASTDVTVNLAAVRPGNRNRQIETVQLALGLVTDLKDAARGVWDSSTESAYQRWQRANGYVGKDASGVPDRASLQRLGSETGLFTVQE
jgi:hypothetical protein